MSMVCCPLEADDEAGPSFSRTDRVAAAKPHGCCECGETIDKGADHELTKGNWDGSWHSFRTCLSCVEIRNHFACGGGWAFGRLWRDLSENFFPNMVAGGPCMEGLSPQAKGRLFERRLAWKLQGGHE